MKLCRQRTIARTVSVSGFGLFHGHDCTLRFKPADPGTGIAFHRVDVTAARPIPARTESVARIPRRTGLTDGHSTVETVEHAMAALAGLGIDNCLVELDAIEPPIGDGSSLHFVSALLIAGLVDQMPPAAWFEPTRLSRIDAGSGQSIIAEPADEFSLSYSLDYGPAAPVRPQSVHASLTPAVFLREIAGARTFVLASEIEGLRKLGYGQRATTDNLLVFHDHGVEHNTLRWPDECARHKLLDCIGDFALCGGRVRGRFHATKSGHHLNHELARSLHSRELITSSVRRAA
ncbi:MAG TPA: UDP-3-O-acyl-N-acetylglucosamine deacetylase [Caulifigura sp.]|nr:UDP-3-O-acyl-N-acetylglucosamine deacetylase [Caulifigura sp.]